MNKSYMKRTTTLQHHANHPLQASALIDPTPRTLVTGQTRPDEKP